MMRYENDFQGVLLPTFQLREQRMKIAQCSECVSEEKRQIWVSQKFSWIKLNGVTKLIEWFAVLQKYGPLKDTLYFPQEGRLSLTVV